MEITLEVPGAVAKALRSRPAEGLFRMKNPGTWFPARDTTTPDAVGVVEEACNALAGDGPQGAAGANRRIEASRRRIARNKAKGRFRRHG